MLTYAQRVRRFFCSLTADCLSGVVAFCFSACSLALFSPPRQAKACLWTEMETEKHLGEDGRGQEAVSGIPCRK